MMYAGDQRSDGWRVVAAVAQEALSLAELPFCPATSTGRLLPIASVTSKRISRKQFLPFRRGDSCFAFRIAGRVARSSSSTNNRSLDVEGLAKLMNSKDIDNPEATSKRHYQATTNATPLLSPYFLYVSESKF